MQGTITGFRRGRHTISHNQMIISIENITEKEKASALKGKKVVWKSKAGNEIAGEIASAHGNNGAIRVIFEKGMPGQSIGTRVEIK